MNILLIGSGGREHALAWAIARSPLCERLFTAPGNPGTAQYGQNRPDLAITDHAALVGFCRSEEIGLVVVELRRQPGRRRRRDAVEPDRSSRLLSHARCH